VSRHHQRRLRGGHGSLRLSTSKGGLSGANQHRRVVEYQPLNGGYSNLLQWPLGELETLGEEARPGFMRVVVSGADLAKLPLLEEATDMTIWTSGGNQYHLFLLSPLPDETT
jgi:hypothetical protein